MNDLGTIYKERKLIYSLTFQKAEEIKNPGILFYRDFNLGLTLGAMRGIIINCQPN